MSKNYVWVCNDCLPEGTEVKSLGHIGPGQCHVCTGTYESGKLNYLDRETADELRATKGCSRCAELSILADTEDWGHPVCYECWCELGEPIEEPPCTCGENDYFGPKTLPHKRECPWA